MWDNVSACRFILVWHCSCSFLHIFWLDEYVACRDRCWYALHCFAGLLVMNMSPSIPAVAVAAVVHMLLSLRSPDPPLPVTSRSQSGRSAGSRRCSRSSFNLNINFTDAWRKFISVWSTVGENTWLLESPRPRTFVRSLRCTVRLDTQHYGRPARTGTSILRPLG